MHDAVLVVDDEVGIRALVARWLSGADFYVDQAATAEEALRVLGSSTGIKVVILDLNMPGQGGAWLLGRLREVHPAVSVILATAEDSVPGTLSLQPSVVGYLVKPLQPQTLIPLVKEGARLSAQQERARQGGATDPIEGFLDRKLTHGGAPTE